MDTCTQDFDNKGACTYCTNLLSIDKCQDTGSQFHDENQQQEKEELHRFID